MKKFLQVLLITLISASSFSQVPYQGLVVWFPLNSNTIDTTGNLLDTIHRINCNYAPDRLSHPNGALRFTTTSDCYIPYDPQLSFGAHNYSFIFWLKSANTTRQTIVSQYSGGQFSHSNFRIDIEDDSVYVIMGNLNNNNMVSYTGSCGTYDFYSTSSGNCSTSAICDNTWHMLTINIDYTNNRIYSYVDKQFQKYASFPSSTNSLCTQSLIIGRFLIPCNYRYYFLGSIDDIKIYNRCIDSADVTAIYNGSTVLSIHDPIPILPTVKNPVTIFPNPTQGIININNCEYGDYVMITAPNGISKQIKLNKNSNIVNILTDGINFIQVYNRANNIKYTTKIIKK